jgi:hypothetical protein
MRLKSRSVTGLRASLSNDQIRMYQCGTTMEQCEAQRMEGLQQRYAVCFRDRRRRGESSQSDPFDAGTAGIAQSCVRGQVHLAELQRKIPVDTGIVNRCSFASLSMAFRSWLNALANTLLSTTTKTFFNSTRAPRQETCRFRVNYTHLPVRSESYSAN